MDGSREEQPRQPSIPRVCGDGARSWVWQGLALLLPAAHLCRTGRPPTVVKPSGGPEGGPLPADPVPPFPAASSAAGHWGCVPTAQPPPEIPRRNVQLTRVGHHALHLPFAWNDSVTSLSVARSVLFPYWFVRRRYLVYYWFVKYNYGL